MFGGSFGAFETSGCHFFDPDHPTYVRIAAIARLRNGKDLIGKTLRRGRLYPRETSYVGYPFRIPPCGELVAWSQVLHRTTVLVALNAADVHRLSFARTVLVEAGRKGMGVIGMKVYAAGNLVRAGARGLTTAEAMGYVLSLPGVSTVIIGCSSPEEVDENARIAREFRPFDEPALRALEQRTGPGAGVFAGYKRPA